MIEDLVRRNRSYRRFHEDFAVDLETLRELVDLARLSASAANMQPLRYLLSCERERNELIFSQLAWAAYLKDWPGPPRGERPSAYIVMLEDTRISHPLRCDHGIAAQSMLLGAVERDLGGCILGAINKPELRKALGIPKEYEVLLVLALGKPKERVVIDEVDLEADIKYWREGDGTHHVPKRRLDDIIVG